MASHFVPLSDPFPEKETYNYHKLVIIAMHACMVAIHANYSCVRYLANLDTSLQYKSNTPIRVSKQLKLCEGLNWCPIIIVN